MAISFPKCAVFVCNRTYVCFKEIAEVQIVCPSSSIDTKDTGWFILSLVAYLKPSLNSTLQHMLPDINIQRLNTIFSFLCFMACVLQS